MEIVVQFLFPEFVVYSLHPCSGLSTETIFCKRPLAAVIAFVIAVN